MLPSWIGWQAKCISQHMTALSIYQLAFWSDAPDLQLALLAEQSCIASIAEVAILPAV